MISLGRVRPRIVEIARDKIGLAADLFDRIRYFGSGCERIAVGTGAKQLIFIFFGVAFHQRCDALTGRLAASHSNLKPGYQAQSFTV
jgi:hypothetical protein